MKLVLKNRMCRESVDCADQAEDSDDSDKWRAVVNTVMNIYNVLY